MDPFLEHPAFWSDFHSRFVNYWCEAVADTLPPHYEATLGERVYLVEHDPEKTYIDILYLPDHSLVATLELLSPANKEQPGRTQYLAKRDALIYQQVHLVELDLLLGGRRLPMEKPLPAADYYYLLSRSEQRPDCQVYHWTLRSPLPTLPIPLGAPDPDIFVDLGTVLTTAYARGRFYRRVKYAGPTPAVVNKRDRAWVEKVAKAAAAK